MLLSKISLTTMTKQIRSVNREVASTAVASRHSAIPARVRTVGEASVCTRQSAGSETFLAWEWIWFPIHVQHPYRGREAASGVGLSPVRNSDPRELEDVRGQGYLLSVRSNAAPFFAL